MGQIQLIHFNKIKITTLEITPTTLVLNKSRKIQEFEITGNKYNVSTKNQKLINYLSHHHLSLYDIICKLYYHYENYNEKVNALDSFKGVTKTSCCPYYGAK